MLAIDSESKALESYFVKYPEVLSSSFATRIWRALPGGYLERFRAGSTTCWQTSKPVADELARLGFEALDDTEKPLSLAVVFATKHKEEVLYHLALAASLLEEGGSVVVVAANDLGAASLERRCRELMGNIESYSKHKCRVFRSRKNGGAINELLLHDWLEAGRLRWVATSGLYSQPGLFSWKSVDEGSRLLAETLPVSLFGRGADLGAGYGYLSRHILTHCPKVRELHAYEAEYKAVKAMESNLAGLGAGVLVELNWADVTLGLGRADFDFVVMNPPFHNGRASLSSLGRTFIRSALKALKPSGHLYMVANRQLPYEEEIAESGGRIVSSTEQGGYKVVVAER